MVGTVGAILGSSVPAFLATRIEPLHLIGVSILLLELAARCAGRLCRLVSEWSEQAHRLNTERLGGGVLDGVRAVVSSPYLLGLCIFMLLYTISSTLLYFNQGAIVEMTFVDDRGMQTAFFGRVDLAVNVLTLLAQFFLTGRILRWLGVAGTSWVAVTIASAWLVLAIWIGGTQKKMAARTVVRP